MTKLTDGLAKRIDELRDSQKQTEGSKQAASEIKTDSGSQKTFILGIAAVLITLILGIAGSLIAAIGVAVAIMVAVVSWNHTTPPIAPVTYSQQQPAKQ